MKVSDNKNPNVEEEKQEDQSRREKLLHDRYHKQREEVADINKFYMTKEGWTEGQSTEAQIMVAQEQKRSGFAKPDRTKDDCSKMALRQSNIKAERKVFRWKPEKETDSVLKLEYLFADVN